MDFGLGLTPIDDCDREWLDGNTIALPAACCASGAIPDEFLPPLTKKNQRRTYTCAGHADSTGREYLNWITTGTTEVYSALAAYLFAKQRYDGSSRDNGTSISSLFQAGQADGLCREETCPFQGVVDRSALTAAAIAEAKQHTHGTYVRLRGYDQVWQFLTAQLGFVIVGTKWFDGQTVQSLGDRRETLAAMRGGLLGYHARAIVGWYAGGDRRDLRIWNSHGDGGRRLAAEVVDDWSDDPMCEIIGCSEQTELAPRQPADPRNTECLI